MTPKDKHTEVAWQAKQREVKTGSVEKTVHSATSAIYTASEIRSVMSHSETQEITGNHITREQQLQNMRLATQKYLQPENQVNTQSILPENTGHTEQAAVQPEILWYKNESNYVPEQPVYNGSSEKYEAKAAQFHAPVSETYKIPEKPDRQVAREQQLKSIRLQPLLTSLTEYYGFDFTNASDALKGCVLSFGNRDGKYVVSLKRYFDGTTSASTDREIIERAYDAMIARRPNVSRWSYEKADCLAQLDGTLDIYAPSENGAGGIDWSWKKSIGAGESGNAAVQAALNAVGSGYSQSRRDDPGWYDCSSLVYRSYAAAGITYLNGMDAASEAECLVNKGMTVGYGELQPGDLIFYSYSANGKYRNISHVAIYLGNGEMVHAADESRGVCKQAMSQSNLSPQLYCRPQ